MLGVVRYRNRIEAGIHMPLLGCLQIVTGCPDDLFLFGWGNGLERTAMPAVLSVANFEENQRIARLSNQINLAGARAVVLANKFDSLAAHKGCCQVFVLASFRAHGLFGHGNGLAISKGCPLHGAFHNPAFQGQ